MVYPFDIAICSSKRDKGPASCSNMMCLYRTPIFIYGHYDKITSWGRHSIVAWRMSWKEIWL